MAKLCTESVVLPLTMHIVGIALLTVLMHAITVKFSFFSAGFVCKVFTTFMVAKLQTSFIALSNLRRLVFDIKLVHKFAQVTEILLWSCSSCATDLRCRTLEL